MAYRRLLRIILVVCLLVSGSLKPMLRNVAAVPAKFDIGSGGIPTMSGNLGGSVTANASLLSDLVVTIDFGELSPLNQSGQVKIVVPVAIRSTAPYQVTVSVSPSGALSGDANAVQLSDIGFGVRNLRSLGAHSTTCGGGSTIVNPFNNDPAQSATLNGSTARATYPSTVRTLGASSVVLFGPTLSIFTNVADFRRDVDNGWVFDAIFTIAPQYYSSGSFGPVVLTFNIGAASCTCPCN
jgi:hypothetical protein